MTIWTYLDSPLEEIPETCIGFVYKITNTSSGKMYIGKKNFYSTRAAQKTVTLKSGIKKKKKVRVTKESDWKSYYGSSEDVQRDVKELGEAVFKREILKFCYTKGELSYYEARFQFEEDVLLKPDQYYNRWISIKVHTIHLKNLLDVQADM